MNQESIAATKNTPARTLGIIAIVLGVLSLFVAWIPYFGLVAIPVAGIGGLLAVVGFILAAIRRLKGWAMPVLGGALCLGAIIVSIVATGGAQHMLSRTLDEVSREKFRVRTGDFESQLSRDEIDYVRNHLVIADVTVETGAGGDPPEVSLSVENKGDRTLTELVVSCYFLDDMGDTIVVEEFTLFSEYSLFDYKPLKPGQTWSRTRPLVASNVPKSWSPGKLEIGISKIGFEE